MASAWPVAAILVATIFSAFVFPVIWLLLFILQRKRKQTTLSWISLFFLVTPVIAFTALFYGDELTLPSKISLLIFFLSPVVNAIALIVALIMAAYHKKP